MTKKELKEKSVDELRLERDKLITEFKDMKFKKVTGVLENPLKLRTVRRSIARINTLLHAVELDKLKEEMGKVESDT
jgi:large subunit ribosomal protein L29